MTLAKFVKNVRGIEKLSLRSHMMTLAYWLRKAGSTDFVASELETVFVEAHLPVPEGGLQADLVKLSKGRSAPFVKVEAGRFSLSADGVDEVENYLRQIGGLIGALDSITHLAGVIAPEAEAGFMEEVRQCIQVGARRAIVVMMWLVTVDHMQRYVIGKKLTEFNQALQARTEYKTHSIKSQDDFDEIRKEKHFIEILSSAGIITHDVRKILDEKLDFRNTCAHPNAILVTDAKVVAFVEDLVHNVILKSPL